RFASGFLQIRSRPRHPCLRLTLPLAGRVEDFHLQVNAPCRAHNEKKGPANYAGPFFRLSHPCRIGRQAAAGMTTTVCFLSMPFVVNLT
ncbi:hypothetical protein C0Z20_30750, partial [Trinickia symbiotica]